MPAGTPVFVASGYPHRCGSPPQSEGAVEGVGRADPADGEGAGVAPREVRAGDEAEEVAEAEAADEGLLTRRPAVDWPR